VLQKEVHGTVEQTKTRSGWPAKKTLVALGIARRSYYRWLKEEKWAQEMAAAPARPVQPYEALAAEKEAVLAYARQHPELRHRELAWRMVDADVVCLSPSTVYRILKEAQLVCPWRRRTKRRRAEEEKAKRPNERWATDVMYLQVSGRRYFYIGFIDDYSRYLVHQELLRRWMVRASVWRQRPHWRRWARELTACRWIDRRCGRITAAAFVPIAALALRRTAVLRQLTRSKVAI
jgi:hypothetical protein